MQESETLNELNISWSNARNPQWLDFMEVLSENRKLTNLSLAYNMLIEEQNYNVRREQAEWDAWEAEEEGREPAKVQEEFLTERN